MAVPVSVTVLPYVWGDDNLRDNQKNWSETLNLYNQENPIHMVNNK